MSNRIILLALCVPFLINSIQNEFVHDDIPAIVRNRDVQAMESTKLNFITFQNLSFDYDSG